MKDGMSYQNESLLEQTGALAEQGYIMKVAGR
jgi:hypothetical protein